MYLSAKNHKPKPETPKLDKIQFSKQYTLKHQVFKDTFWRKKRHLVKRSMLMFPFDLIL